VQLRGFFDGPLWVDVAPYDTAHVPLVNQTQSVFALVNATGRSGLACGALYGTVPTVPEAWKCLYGAFRLPTVHTQWLASAPQFDEDQLVYDVGAKPPYSGAQLAYADIFQRNVRSAVMQLPSAQQGGSAVYSSACFGRCTSVSGQFGHVTVDGISLKDYLGDWYFGGPLGNRPQVVEACAGFGCGACRAPPADVAPAPPLPPARAGPLSPSLAMHSALAAACARHNKDILAQAWLEALKIEIRAALEATGRCKLVFALGGPDLAKADDDDPSSGVCFEVTKDGVRVGKVMLGSKVEPEVLLGPRFWVAPTNWYAPGPDLDACYSVRVEEAPELDSDGEYSGQDTKRWVLMYGTKSWANKLMELRGRWEASREAVRPLDDLWAWVLAVAAFDHPATPVPALVKASVKRYALDDAEFETALSVKGVYDAAFCAAQA
jgi:hypothetical protein